MDKRKYNKQGRIVISEEREHGITYRTYPFPETDGKYNLLREKLLSAENIRYLSSIGVRILPEYTALEEIQDIIDMLDPVCFRLEYITETGAEEDMFVTGLYQYDGETDGHFIHGRSYFCTEDGDYVFMLIGEDRKDYDCDKDQFHLIEAYHSLNPALYLPDSSPVNE